MKRLYEKNQLRHFLVWLVCYLGISLVVINLGTNLGIAMHAAAVVPLGVLSIVLFLYLRRTGIGRDIGLGVSPAVSLARMWFYLPLLLLVCFPLVMGVDEDVTWLGALIVGSWALFVGFLEEVLMRGMLLTALLRQWRPLWAVLVSAATFGVGHIVSLAIGQGVVDTGLQIINATIVGLLFTLVVVATGNLHAVILAHVLYNAIAQLSQVTDSAVLLLPGVIALIVYGGWLLYGAGGQERMRALGRKRQEPPVATSQRDIRARRRR